MVKKNRKNKKKLLDASKPLPDWGIGSKLAKIYWQHKNFYKITSINLKRDCFHGKAWGNFHRNGEPTTKTLVRINGAKKHVWKLVNDAPKKTYETTLKFRLVIRTCEVNAKVNVHLFHWFLSNSICKLGRQDLFRS